jgi:hypothetical protein
VLVTLRVDDLPDRSTAAAAAGAGTTRMADFGHRSRALAYYAANRAVGNSVAVADQHWRPLAPGATKTKIIETKLKINVDFKKVVGCRCLRVTLRAWTNRG